MFSKEACRKNLSIISKRLSCEPIKSKYYESELEDILKDAGFSKVDFLSAKWLVDNYLGGEKKAFDMPDEATSILAAII